VWGHGLGQAPGVGGISRGGGSTGLLWGDESVGDRDRFETKLLPPTQFLDLESSARVGLGADVPEVAPVGEGAGLVDVEGSAGKAAWRRRLSPRHRHAVSTFFSSSEDD